MPPESSPEQTEKIARFLYEASPFSIVLVARALKVSPPTLRNWAKKNKWPKRKTSQALKAAFQRPPSDRAHLLEKLWANVDKALERLTLENDEHDKDIKTLAALIGALDKLSTLDQKSATKEENETAVQDLRREHTKRLQSLPGETKASLAEEPQQT